ncbi:hypothetical protein [uncultured Microscilla sp.]|uniref:hypothetical protein n=1 Tax=uncultured Microscilla sp. TaxID=432653 RepID=UPI002611B520|nr:hypothetical protein [uncultured Microscilla sp.]
MPYDIESNEQFEVYELNAPRLEKALRTIEDNIGLEIEVDETSTKYAIPTHYGLENFTNSDNEPLNVVRSFNINLL